MADAPPVIGDKKQHYEPIYILSAVFGAVFIIGPLVVHKGENKGIIQCCIMLTAFSMWIFWVTVYIAQMDPLVGPRLPRETLAWASYKWGRVPTSD